MAQSLDRPLLALSFLAGDVTAGTGRFNVAQGALATLVGIAASLGNLLAEQVVQYAGYDSAFYFLAAVALAGTVLFMAFMPETAAHALANADGRPRPGRGPAG